VGRRKADGSVSVPIVHLHPISAKPALAATNPNQVWTLEITKLRGPAKWTFFNLYSIVDIPSRYVGGWMLAHRKSQQIAARQIRETPVKEGIQRDRLTIHSDRVPAMRSPAVAQVSSLTWGLLRHLSTPRVATFRDVDKDIRNLTPIASFLENFDEHKLPSHRGCRCRHAESWRPRLVQLGGTRTVHDSPAVESERSRAPVS